MKRPSLRLAVEINQRVRRDDEWFDESDDLERVESALRSIEDHLDPVEAAAVVAFRIARAQGFAEGNKRTALLLARWTLDNNGLDGRRIIEPDDRELATCSFVQHPVATSKLTYSSFSLNELELQQHLILNQVKTVR